MSRPLFLGAAAVVALAPIPSALRAQVVATAVVTNPSPYLSQWQTDPTIALLTITNTTQADVPVTSTARVLQGQATVLQAPGLITTIPGTPATSVYRTPQIARWSAATIGPNAPASLRDERVLAEGSYTLCVDLVDGQGGVVTACAPFTVSLASPPRLVAPLDRRDVVTRHPVLQWTPAVSARTPSVAYTLRLVEVYAGQTPTRAIEANRAIFESVVRNLTTVQYPLGAEPLLPGRCYAWRVQARADQGANDAPPGAPIGRNEGRSEVFSFCYRPPEDKLESLRQRADTSTRDTLAADSATAPRPRPAQPEPTVRNSSASRLHSASSAYSTAAFSAAAAATGFRGSATLTADAYGHSGAGTTTRPNSTQRLRLTGTLGGGDSASGAWTAPVELLVSSEEKTNRQRISQLRISPTWRAVTLHLGSVIPQFSEYTLYDATLLGGGAELRPRSNVYASAWLGESQRAVRPTDPTLTPQFARTLGAAMVGWGTDQGANLRADVLFAKDRRGSLGSIGDTTGAAAPHDNTVIGVRGQLPLWRDRVLAGAAASRSRYRHDVRASDVGDVDGNAGHLSLAYRMPSWSLGATVARVDANYVSLGNTQLVSDRVDYQLSGAFQRAKLNGMITAGVRRNNLDGSLDATTRTSGIYSLALGWTPSPSWGVDASASNTTIDAVARDTTFLRNGTHVLTLTPRFGWRRGSASHQVVVSGAYQGSDNEADVGPAPANVVSRTGTLTYALAFDAGLALDLSASTSRTDVAGTATTIDALTPGVGYAFRLPGGAQPLQTRAAVQFTSSKSPGERLRELLPVLQLGYALAPGHTVTLDVRRRSYRPGAATLGVGRFDETTAVLEYTRGF